MKNLSFSPALFCCAIAVNAHSNSMTIYGKNGGFTTTQNPDGTQSTTLIYDSWYDLVCAKMESTGPILTRGVNFSLTTFTEEGIVSESQGFSNFQA